MQQILHSIPKLVKKIKGTSSYHSYHYAFYIRGKTFVCATNTRNCHAETNLIKKLHRLHIYKTGIILVLRMRHFGTSLSKPCFNCENQLKKCKMFKNVLYSNNYGGLEEERISKLHSGKRKIKH